VLQIAPSGYRRHVAQQRNPALRCCRAQRDDALTLEIQRVWDANMQCYGAVKVWKQLRREGIEVARCTVERLMRRAGLQGIRRGQIVQTTVAGDKALCPLDRVQRQFHADRPNQLWVSDFTYVSTWQGWLYVAFVIDVFARRIVGWRVSTSMKTDFVLDALEQALYARQPHCSGGLIHPATVEASTSRSAIPNGWQRPALSLRLAARETATTTPWPKPSTGCTRPS
jgi:transposase InsO family protein